MPINNPPILIATGDVTGSGNISIPLVIGAAKVTAAAISASAVTAAAIAANAVISTKISAGAVTLAAISAAAVGSAALSANAVGYAALVAASSAGIIGSAASASNYSLIAAGQFPATITNDAAAASRVGELQTATVNSAAFIALTTGQASTVTSIALGSGDWIISGTLQFTGATTTTVSFVRGGLSTSSATLSTTPGQYSLSAVFGSALYLIANGVNGPTIGVGPMQASLSTTTTLFLIADSTFTGTASAGGIIAARRPR